MQPTHRRALRLTAVLAAGSALAGCGVLASTATTTVSPESTVTPGPVSTFVQTPAVPNTSAPSLSNTGTNLPVVVASLIKYGQWLIANPDPERVSEIAAPGCAASNDLIRETRSLVAQGAYVTTTAPTVTGLRWASPSPSGGTVPFGDQATLFFQVSRPAEALTMRTVGQETQVISYLPELKATTVRVDLFRATDKKWRFCEVTTPLDSNSADSVTSLL
ncbi:hypothetical protein [Actinoplanes regularis]|uniref:hypothetical protein n=1 Tax=Actinoplanes regularis TaxID=52697 RepID=UPI002557B860|nr:hypothetical protein [Actinoplanes regularis]GLW31674.1 hypothetical protein Areg01_46140 [Actinoplanes regularis]